mmetsp:Transcript_2218/g.6187  ORF Transcript_2218/g.6187 Transcript_2218/m.6187 type:complete len:84 (-) Transcript_2218:503-754(-)
MLATQAGAVQMILSSNTGRHAAARAEEGSNEMANTPAVLRASALPSYTTPRKAGDGRVEGSSAKAGAAAQRPQAGCCRNPKRN